MMQLFSCFFNFSICRQCPHHHAVPHTFQVSGWTYLPRNDNNSQGNLSKSWRHCITLWHGRSRVSGHPHALCPLFQMLQWKFPPPQDPEDYPDDIPSNATTACFSKLIVWQNDQNQLFEMYEGVVQCVRNQTQAANNEDYLVELDNPMLDLLIPNPSTFTTTSLIIISKST